MHPARLDRVQRMEVGSKSNTWILGPSTVIHVPSSSMHVPTPTDMSISYNAAPLVSVHFDWA